uniref:Uncharacterized protein n=1 Tax=Amphilophus citrinellus TaxID=61819 RepID=A0A3Q0R1D8_AMPCI
MQASGQQRSAYMHAHTHIHTLNRIGSNYTTIEGCQQQAFLSVCVSSLPGSVFNLAPPHMFGNRLNPNSTMAALIAQSEVVNLPIDLSISPFSINALSLPPFSSPIGGLQIRGETLPPVATSIEQLLERQWNEGQSFLLQQGTQGDGERTQALFCHHIPPPTPGGEQEAGGAD